MFYNGEQRIVTESTIEKFLLLMEDTPLQESFIQNADSTLRRTLYLLKKDYFNGKEWKDVWSYFYSKKVVPKKERWKEKAFRDLEQKRLKTPKELYRLYVEYSKEYSGDDLESKLAAPKKLVIDWAVQDHTRLYEYPFFDDKTPKTKVSALEDDLATVYLIFLKNEWDIELRQNGKIVIEMPYDNQVIYNNRVSRSKFKADGEIEQDGKMMPYKDVGIDEAPVRIMVDTNPDALQLTNPLHMTHDIYDLDQVDRDIMTALLEYRKENFAIDKTIDVRLGDLVRDVYESDGKKNYDAVRNRLVKLQRIRFTHVIPEEIDGVITGEVKYKEHMGFIEYIKEIVTPQGETYMSIEVNQGLHKRFINNQTLKIYKDQIYSLDSRYRSMLYYMQKERIKAYHTGKDSADLTLINFRANIQFRYSSKRKIVEEISESLDEIIKKNLIVRSYTSGPNQFKIQFKPLSQQEVRDIIGEKNDRINIQQLLTTNNDDF